MCKNTHAVTHTQICTTQARLIKKVTIFKRENAGTSEMPGSRIHANALPAVVDYNKYTIGFGNLGRKHPDEFYIES